MNTKIKVVDDFIPESNFKPIQDAMLGLNFPWFYNKVIDGYEDVNKEDRFQFTHTFYSHNRPQSDYYDNWYDLLFGPIIQYGVFERIKANLLTKHTEIVENTFHTDIVPAPKQLSTSIYYLNTNNGYTKFEDGTMVESVANRLVTFPANIKHTGTTCTDEKTRVVLNLLYLQL